MDPNVKIINFYNQIWGIIINCSLIGILIVNGISEDNRKDKDFDPLRFSRGGKPGGEGKKGDNPKDELGRFTELYLKRLKETDKAAYDQLVELREKSPHEFYAEIFKRWRERDFSQKTPGIPRNLDTYEKGDNFSEEREKEKSEFNGKRMGGEGGRGWGGLGGPPKGLLDRFLGELKKQNVGEYERITQLLEKDPEEGRKQIFEYFHRFRREYFKPDPRVKELIEQYRMGPPDRKEEIRQQLELIVKEGFEERIRGRLEQLTIMKQRLADLENQLQRQLEQKEEICRKQVEWMLQEENKEDVENKRDISPPENFKN